MVLQMCVRYQAYEKPRFSLTCTHALFCVPRIHPGRNAGEGKGLLLWLFLFDFSEPTKQGESLARACLAAIGSLSFCADPDHPCLDFPWRWSLCGSSSADPQCSAKCPWGLEDWVWGSKRPEVFLCIRAAFPRADQPPFLPLPSACASISLSCLRLS